MSFLNPSTHYISTNPLCWITVFLLTISPFVRAQIISDSFTDGNFTSNPVWLGITEDFIVNVNDQLQLSNDAASQSYLSTSFSSVSLNDKEWHFWIKQSFAGSDNNQSRFYLSSGNAALSYSGNGSCGSQGYFLKFGEGGSLDAIRLFRDDGAGTPIEILAGTSSFISASFEVRIKVTRDNLGLWRLYADPTGGSNYSLQASAIDNTYTTSSNLGWVCNYTLTNADNFYLDDLYFGDIVVDNTPPELLSATAITSSTLDVLFTETIEINSAQNTIHYEVNSFGTPISALRDDSNFSLVHLTFSSEFPGNQTLTLVVTGIEDESGNVMPESETDFLWFISSQPSFRSVVFNEVLADPTPTVGLPDAEYIEIYNSSADAFDLLGWEFVNSTTAKILPTYVIAPGAYLILCDESVVDLFSPSLGIPSFTALTNDGDSLTLLDGNGNIIDVLNYDVAWYESLEKQDGGWSLEQINPNFPCQGGSSNWQESIDPTGGSPGVVNSINDLSPDLTQPFVVSYGILNATTLQVHFSEPLDISTFSPLDWSLVPFNSVISATWNSNLDEVQLTIMFALSSGSIVQLSVESVSDCSGNVMATTILDFILGSIPEEGSVRISEIMADPDPSILAPPAEYIEIYSLSDNLIDLMGTSLNGKMIEEQVLIQPGSYVVLADQSNALAFLSLSNVHFMTDFPGLTNSGLALSLINPEGSEVDAVTYNLDWYHDSNKEDGGWSLELINPFDPCSDIDNWTASEDARGGTAGEENSVYNIADDITAPSLLYLVMQPQESVTLHFDEPLDENSLTNLVWLVNGMPIDTDQAQVDVQNPHALILYYGEMEEQELYSFILEGLTDCWGNIIFGVTGIFGLPSIPEAGDLIINEILPDPYAEGSDFIEIYNRSENIISLQEWKLSNGMNGIPEDIEAITSEARILFPGEFLALTINGEKLPEFYPYTRKKQVFEMSSFPTYNVDAGEVILLLPNGTVSDLVPYSDQMHYPLLNSSDGVSLERISAYRLSDDPTNWHSAAQSQGFATPGYVNSQTYTGGFNAEGITVDPEIFSPDNDGYADVTTISYENDTPGWVANVTIYDSEGREVRQLRSNELLGTNGSISWDGFTEERQLSPIGIYVIHFEAFDDSGHVNSVRKTCVLAQRIN